MDRKSLWQKLTNLLFRDHNEQNRSVRIKPRSENEDAFSVHRKSVLNSNQTNDETEETEARSVQSALAMPLENKQVPIRQEESSKAGEISSSPVENDSTSEVGREYHNKTKEGHNEHNSKKTVTDESDASLQSRCKDFEWPELSSTNDGLSQQHNAVREIIERIRKSKSASRTIKAVTRQSTEPVIKKTSGKASDLYPISPILDHATQYPGSPRKQVKSIVIGLDWGTSCTKVILRDPYGINSPTYLVDFEELGVAGQTYLLPSSIFISEDGVASLVDQRNGSSIDDIKLRLLQPGNGLISVGTNGGAYSYEVAALYIAATLRYIRKWFLCEQADIYKSFFIDWEFNLGIPAKGYDDSAICNVFMEVARVGWWLSAQEGPLSLDRVRDGFNESRNGTLDAGLHDYALNVIPEVAAQVVGYAKSKHRRQGLHVLVDVGAATLDAAGFILSESEGEDGYSILSAEVEPKGAFKLHRERIGAVVNSCKQWGRIYPEYSAWCEDLSSKCHPQVLVPAGMSEYYPPRIRERYRVPNEPDESYRNLCWRTVHKVLDEIRKRKDPNAAAWRRGLPIFLCGGGQDVEPYIKGLMNVRSWWKTNTKVAPFEIRVLPRPENLKADGLKEKDYHRISVAYGLCYPVDQIGKVKPPSAVRDFIVENRKENGINYEDTKDWT